MLVSTYMTKQNPVVHFEMPAKDKKRVAEFYSKVFGWNMIQLDKNMSNYLIAQTAETDQNRMVKTPGAINGGFFDYKDDDLNRVPHLVISVNNLDESMKLVKEAGGKIEGKKMIIEGVGSYASFRDSEDNVVGMLQASR